MCGKEGLEYSEVGLYLSRTGLNYKISSGAYDLVSVAADEPDVLPGGLTSPLVGIPFISLC